jgi:iron complex transport system ATP-binding protein
MIEARSVSVRVSGAALLKDVSVALEPGQVTVIIGPNGAGKSTLLRVLSGELRPSGGEVRLDDRPLPAISAASLASRRAIVPQATTLAFDFRAVEVVLLGCTVPGFGLDIGNIEMAAIAALQRVGLTGLEHRPYAHLSGGERQRVHVARALCQLATSPVQSPGQKSLLMDEPTSSLDISHQDLVLEEARQQAADGLAVLMVLHDLNLASAFADHLLLLSAGEVIAAGAPRDVLRDDLLSAAYRCAVTTRKVPLDDDRPFVLPRALTAARAAPAARHRP